jgi:hypothetical protein
MSRLGFGFVALAISALIAILVLPAAVGWIRSPESTPLPQPLEVADEPSWRVGADERRSGPATLRKTMQPRAGQRSRAPAVPLTSASSQPRSTTVARARVVSPEPEPAGTASPRRAEPASPSGVPRPSRPRPAPARTPPAPSLPADDDDDNEVDDTSDDDADLGDDDFDD